MREELAAYLNYTFLQSEDGRETEFRIANLVINRPEQANAFSGELMQRITELLHAVDSDPTVRILLLQGSGKHFSAGADLQWMKASAQLGYEQNLIDSQKLTTMFEALSHLKIPTIAVVKGAVFGGAVGLLAACDYAFAWEGTKVCLSEAKIGLIPAVILPYLQRKIPAATLHRMVMTAQVVGAEELQKLGLVVQVGNRSQLEKALIAEVNALLQTSPEALAAYKKLSSTLPKGEQDISTAKAIASIRASEMGQHGLQCFFQKKTPNWVLHAPAHANLLIP